MANLSHIAKTPSGPTISSNIANLFFRLSSTFKVDLHQLFHDLDRKALQDPFSRLPLDLIETLMCRLQETVNDPDLGLHIAEHFEIPMDLLNFIVFNSSSLETALKNLCKYNALFQEFCQPVYTITGKLAKLSFRTVPGIKVYRLMTEGYMAYYYKLCERLIGKEIELDHVDFSHSKPKNIVEHLRIFNTDILFDQEENSLWFSRDYLSLPIPAANPELLNQIELHAKHLLEKMHCNDSILSKVETAILLALPKGYTDIASISATLGFSSRNLQNKLKSEGSKYKNLQDSIKRDQAKYLLSNTKMSILDIGCLLGYSEQSAFNRAFKRWTNLSPGEYRLQTFNY